VVRSLCQSYGVNAAVVDPADIAEKALDWLIASARATEQGLAWADTRSDDELVPNLYSGGAGIVMTLLEAYGHYGDDRFADLAIEASRDVGANVESWEHSGLYFGLTGMAVALQSVHEVLGDSLARESALRALELVRDRFDGERWNDQFELLGGNAGIALGALRVGDLDLAVTAVTPYLERAEATTAGVHWEVRTGIAARLHHISHGTLGIVEALAAVGSAAARPDLIHLALAGAADVVSRNEALSGGFLVPHSDPPHRPERVERYSYGWCHGPTGDAQVFRLLAAATGEPKWMDLTDRCWQTVTTSGLPERTRPGFWDNSGRCCGTAGVLAFACDHDVERDLDGTFARVLAEDICARATIDDEGARWSNFEHRETPSDLEPRVGWAMGNAGIIRELLRFIRIDEGRTPDYYVGWPDQPATGPTSL
jgi:Lanthionine synthetase C-like protein